jgi:hypothetical protein
MAGLNNDNCPAELLDALRRAGEPIRAPGVVWAVMVDKALEPDRQSLVRVTDGVECLVPSFETGPSMEPRAFFLPEIKGGSEKSTMILALDSSWLAQVSSAIIACVRVSLKDPPCRDCQSPSRRKTAASPVQRFL